VLRPDEVKPETWAITAGRPAPVPGATLNTAVVAASIYVLGELADAAAVDRACRATQIIRYGTSLGGVETCMERRSAHRGQEHIPAGLIRLSTGCENPEDLWSDLSAALDGS
jgi:cystathionine beta-lyase/cystathionine gamma-synthase